MAHVILIPPVIPSVKVYYRMYKLRLKRDERDLSHGCGVIVGLLKKRGMRRTYLLHMIKPFNCLFPRREASDTHIDSMHILTIGLYPTVPML